MKVFKNFFFNGQNTYICGLHIFKSPKAVETHKAARDRNYSHFINKNMENSKGQMTYAWDPIFSNPSQDFKFLTMTFVVRLLSSAAAFNICFHRHY